MIYAVVECGQPSAARQRLAEFVGDGIPQIMVHPVTMCQDEAVSLEHILEFVAGLQV